MSGMCFDAADPPSKFGASMGATRLQLMARRRADEITRSLGQAIRDLREGSGLTLTAVAGAAGVDRRFLARIESGERGASVETLTTVLAVLGADLSIKAFPSTGPRIRDRIQAAMVESFLREIDRRWTALPEVPVRKPARGVIDVVLSDPRIPVVVASEFQSELRRLEQQVRWHREKELSLPSAELWDRLVASETPATSRLLVLRSTRTMRELADAFAATLGAAYPARTVDALDALRGQGTWPGDAIVWMRVEAGNGTLLDAPPRGVRLGR